MMHAIRNLIANVGDELTAPIKMFVPSMVRNVRVTWDGVQGELAICDDEEAQSNRQAQPGDREGRPYISPAIHFESHLLGGHHISTMLAAYTVGQHCGLKPVEMQDALANLRPLPGRLHPLQGKEGARLLDDTHNAAPASVIAGLETLKKLPATFRIAVLGEMLWLGDFEEDAYRLVGQKAAQCVDYLILRGENTTLIAESAIKAGLLAERIIITSTHEDAAQAVRNLIVGADKSAVGAINRPLRLMDKERWAR